MAADYLVTVWDGWNSHFRMVVNLTRFCQEAGVWTVQKRDDGTVYRGVPVKRSQLKRMFQLIKYYCDPEQIESVYRYLSDEFPDWAKVFKKERAKR